MKFKRALSVFIDNFKTTYKLLLYKAVILVIFGLLYTAVIYPVIYQLLESAQLNALIESVSAFAENFFNGEVAVLGDLSAEIKVNFENFVLFLGTLTANIVWGVILIFIIFIVQNFLMDLGNFTAAAMINDKMQLQAKSPFINTFIKNFTRACAFAAVYAPLNVIYNVIAIMLSYVVFFMLCGYFLPIVLQVLLFVSFVVFAVSFKKAHLAGWLPSIVSGKMKLSQAFTNSLKLAEKDRWTLVSDFVVLNLIILAVVTSTTVFTLGAATIIAAPAATVLLYSYKFVNYFTENDMKYFVDETTIVKPKKEHKLTREEFFKGE